MSDTPKPPVLDAFGLEKIPLHGGKDEATDRDFSRAPITSGGTITGKAFQTDNVDPRITFDSAAMICHNQAGQTTFRIDIATGNVYLLTSATGGAGVKFVNAAGATIGQIIQDGSVLGGGFTIEALDNIQLIAEPTLGGGGLPITYLELFQAAAAFTLSAQFDANDSVGIAATSGGGGPTGRISLQAIDAGVFTNVDVVKGHVIMSSGGVEKDVLCAMAAFTTVVGVRWTAAGAGSVGGQFDHYRQVRGSTAGARVTPAGAAYTPATAVNVAAATIITILDVGAFFAVSATAAGNVVAVGSVIYS